MAMGLLVTMSSWPRLLNEIGSPKQEALADWSCRGVLSLVSPFDHVCLFHFNAFSHIHMS
jgi:hypothetical protein